MTPRKRIIRARDVLADVQAGFSEAQLMEKYKVSSKGLQTIFQKIAGSGLIDPMELRRRYQVFSDTVVQDLASLRLTTEETLTCLLPVYDLHKPERRGALCELTENGFVLNGFPTTKGETVTIVFDCELFFQVPSFPAEARCLWTKRESHTGDPVAGFEITAMDLESRPLLSKLAKALKPL
jgi:hypothetical protein